MRRTHSRELKLEITRALVSGEKRLAQVCREHSLCETLVRGWRKQYEDKGEAAFQPVGHSPEQDDKARIRALEESLGRAHLDNEFLRAALLKKGCAPPRSSP